MKWEDMGNQVWHLQPTFIFVWHLVRKWMFWALKHRLNVDQIEGFKEAICKQKDGNSKGMRLRSDDGKAYCGGKVLSVSRVIIHDICNAVDNFCPSKPKWVIGHNSGDGKVFQKLFRRHIKVWGIPFLIRLEKTRALMKYQTTASWKVSTVCHFGETWLADMIWYDMIMLLGINPTETGSIRIHRMREWWMATSWMKAHHWIYQLQLFTGLLNTLGKINQSNARRERIVGRSIHWRKDNDWVRIWGVGAPKENARGINLAIVVSK